MASVLRAESSHGRTAIDPWTAVTFTGRSAVEAQGGQKRGVNGSSQIRQHRASLLAAGVDDGLEVGGEGVAAVAPAAEAALAPEDEAASSRSAWLLVGSTPRSSTKRHSAARWASMSVHDLSPVSPDPVLSPVSPDPLPRTRVRHSVGDVGRGTTLLGSPRDTHGMPIATTGLMGHPLRLVPSRGRLRDDHSYRSRALPPAARSRGSRHRSRCARSCTVAVSRHPALRLRLPLQPCPAAGVHR